MWFWNPLRTEAQLTSQWNFGRMGLGESEPIHRSLIDDLLRRGDPVYVSPTSAPRARAKVSNPTDSALLVSPLIHDGDVIGVLEVCLGPRPVRGRTKAAQTGYLMLANAIAGILVAGIQHRVRQSMLSGAVQETGSSLDSATAQLDSLEQEISSHQAAIRRCIENTLSHLKGWTSNSLRDKQTFATRVHRLLDSHGLRVVCPTCGEPSILRAQATGNSRAGAFTFDHYLENGRTFHGGLAQLPILQVVGKPARKPRS
jgi:predicted RNA-binding Zn-ribbon protein involved in translation (DUF1610 family)